jgi:bacterioferritin-associated ferredoxin
MSALPISSSAWAAGSDKPEKEEVRIGFTATTTQDSWVYHPEKVLGTTAEWVAKYPNTARAVTAAMVTHDVDEAVLLAMRDGVPIDALRRWIFAPRAEPPVAAAAPRKVICNCLDVSEAEIKREIAAGANLPVLQEKLKCGTSCGSCVPEIKRMLAVPQPA